jgi:DNA mismatch repair protein MutH
MREFVDSAGVAWRVWSTVPARAVLGGTLDQGWLTFESSTERRRLAPVPDGWMEVSVERLELLCRGARPVGAPLRWEPNRREPDSRA